jgi:benzoyl-CoA reductase subunit D
MMLSAGIDVGAENIKLAIMDGSLLLAHTTVRGGWDTKASLQRAFDELAGRSAVDVNKIKFIGATGMGKESVSCATLRATDSTCSAKGSIWLLPSTRTVIDMGAEKSHVFKCDATGAVLQFARNEHCAAGAGAFIEEVASALELETRDIGRLALTSTKRITLNSTCAIFAESEVISLINEGAERADIARAICDVLASKTASLLQSVGMERDIIFIGGVARNIGVVNSMRSRLNQDIIAPQEPEIVTAIGAALLAQTA